MRFAVTLPNEITYHTPGRHFNITMPPELVHELLQSNILRYDNERDAESRAKKSPMGKAWAQGWTRVIMQWQLDALIWYRQRCMSTLEDGEEKKMDNELRQRRMVGCKLPIAMRQPGFIAFSPGPAAADNVSQNIRNGQEIIHPRSSRW